LSGVITPDVAVVLHSFEEQNMTYCGYHGHSALQIEWVRPRTDEHEKKAKAT
jgi:hypothetical protein